MPKPKEIIEDAIEHIVDYLDDIDGLLVYEGVAILNMAMIEISRRAINSTNDELRKN